MTGYFDLLKRWCDGLLAWRVCVPEHESVRDALLCPACGLIHGRCGDAVYPLMCVGNATGERKYVEAAVALQRWSDRMSRPDGSWVNDANSDWRGITVFGTIALGEALRHHGRLLDDATVDRWSSRLRQAADFLMRYSDIRDKIINYPISAAAALAVADHIIQDERYAERAGELARIGLRHITREGLLYGESDPRETVTPKGCRSVDIAYNVEESLGSLALYATLSGNSEVLGATVESLRAHLAFMLPDGAWDDSFATRSYKWTYWGSRTSDGCQVAMSLLADHDERFAEAAWRNLQLLAACTHEGLLHGGPHYVTHGEPPCIHHTFTHAKALATAVDHCGRDWRPARPTALPRDESPALQRFEVIATHLAAVGPWRATVTEYDFPFGAHASGGAMTLLHHAAYGPVLAASMPQYRMIEPNNMQLVHDDTCLSLTPRVEVVAAGKTYTNVTDYTARLEHARRDGWVTFKAAGKLTGADYRTTPRKPRHFHITYELTDGAVAISAGVSPIASRDVAELVVPVVAHRGQTVRWVDGSTVEIDKPGRTLSVCTDAPDGFVEHVERRGFDPCPGLEALPLRVRLKPGQAARVVIRA